MNTTHIRKRFAWLLLSICFLPTSYGATLFQVSTLQALVSGIYDGEVPLKQLLTHGNFGIGTFNGLNGEMIILNGTVYQITATGSVEKPELSVMVPFAAITAFESTNRITLSDTMTINALCLRLDSCLRSKNLFYAVKITGEFDSLTTRSIPQQEKPYSPMKDVIHYQSVFSLNAKTGTIVGFRCPDYAQGVNMPGYHLHFIAADTLSGGHVLKGTVHNAVVEWQELNAFTMALPGDSCFLGANLKAQDEATIKKIEK
jgi:acetolactate decarboxylase